MNDIARTETCGTQSPSQKLPQKLVSNDEEFLCSLFLYFLSFSPSCVCVHNFFLNTFLTVHPHSFFVEICVAVLPLFSCNASVGCMKDLNESEKYMCSK